MSDGAAGALTPLEIASGLVTGTAADCSPLPPPPPGVGARAAFERPVLRALSRPPCVVSFSGGRDSSAVLAVATQLARREGLELPVPVTLRFPEDPHSQEAEWQEQVVGRLGLAEWQRLTMTDEVDAIGPYASEALSRHGLLWPFNTHFHRPILECARGGSALTGIGGDQLLLPSWWRRVNHVLARRVRPRPRDMLRVAVAYGPAATRRVRFRRGAGPMTLPWLRPEAQQAFLRRWADHVVHGEVAWDRWVRGSLWPSRARVLRAHNLAKLASTVDAEVVNPFEDPVFLATVAHERGRAGYWDRTTAMLDLFGDALPETLCRRRTKAGFNRSFWHHRSRAFAASWDGSGLDPAVEALVDVPALRAAWSGDDIDARCLLLLQSLWLRTAGDRALSDAVPPHP